MKYVLIPLRGAIDSNFFPLTWYMSTWEYSGLCVCVHVYVCAQLIPNTIGLTSHTLAGMHALPSEKGLLFSVHTLAKRELL